MSERLMKNFPIEFEGNTYWRSRSCTTVGFVFCFDKEGFVCVLANQRGPGAADNFGKWNVPCGYIDFDENGNEGVARETFEETGIKINPEQFHFDSVTFSKNNDQNINLRYWTKLDGTIDDYPLSNAANEENETSDIRWIRIKDLGEYEWAFGHQTAIPEICHKHVYFYADENNNQHPATFLVRMDIVELKDNQFVSSEILVACDSGEKCKEYIANHIRMTEDFYVKQGITHEPFIITDYDAVVKWHGGDKPFMYWYTFSPIEKYE